MNVVPNCLVVELVLIHGLVVLSNVCRAGRAVVTALAEKRLERVVVGACLRRQLRCP